MRARRSAFSLGLVILLAAAVMLLRPVPMVRATEPEAGSIPPVCREKLPLPSEYEFRKSEYELLLGRFMAAECYKHLGWAHDVQIRPSGPTIATLGTSTADPHLPAWVSQSWAVHGSVLVYYSPDVYRWMCERDAAGKREFVTECRETCPQCKLDGQGEIRPIADGEMVVKLMYGTTTAEMLRDPSPAGRKLLSIPFMVKDQQGAKDGWWWATWVPTDIVPQEAQLDWPPPVNFPYPWMGFGYYCANCHASAAAELTFSNLAFVLGKPDSFPTFYLQDEPPLLDDNPTDDVDVASDAHVEMAPAHDHIHPHGPPAQVSRVSEPLSTYTKDFLATFGAGRVTKPTWKEASAKLSMPPEPYDHVVSGAGGDGPPLYLTSDQCVGCHAAGSTGMHFDMTLQPASQKPYEGLINIAPYGEWRSSPMGLAGRDPVFFSQLESEETLHAGIAPVIQDLCLHCHGVMGQRQFCLDQFPGDPDKANEICNNTALLGLNQNSQPIVKRELFQRRMLNAIPYQAVTPEQQRDSRYGGLARDGVSCTSCHHIQIDERTPAGNTFTGDFAVSGPAVIHGPFEGPQQVPMDHTLGVKPIQYAGIQSSKICGSCHSVVLPVFDGSKPYIDPKTGKPKVIIEQATYPEWVLSDFSDEGGGSTPRSCQSCHMPSSYPGVDGILETRIASIQEASNMPQTENRLPMSDIDLKPRQPFSRHALVGLNVFFNKIAQQFPDILGIRIQDPMLVSRGVAPLATTYNSMIQQADNETATVTVTGVEVNGGQLKARVQVQNLAGHKLPSGVGFRRLFVELTVLDADGQPIWVSGRTSPAGAIVDENGQPVKGEFFWRSDCKPMTVAEQKDWFQPHHENITRQDQVQIYQELERDPRGKLTTSFLALAHDLKDNRLLPRGWDPSVERAQKAGLGSSKLSAEDLVHDILPKLPSAMGGQVRDPYYLPRSQGGLGGGGDALTYTIPLSDLKGRRPATVQARLFYQSIPPYFLQDRFCTAPEKPDTSRLFFLTGHLDLSNTRGEGWKLLVVSSGAVAVPG
jgi:hypothetical protein